MVFQETDNKSMLKVLTIEKKHDTKNICNMATFTV